MILVLVLVAGAAACSVQPVIDATAAEISEDPDPFDQLMEIREARSGGSSGWLLFLVLVGVLLLAAAVFTIDRTPRILKEIRLNRRRRPRQRRPNQQPAPLPRLPEVQTWRND